MKRVSRATRVTYVTIQTPHTERQLPAFSSLLASHWLVGVRLEPMSGQAEFSSTWSPSAGPVGGGVLGNW